MSPGLFVFETLCKAGNALEGLREMYRPGSDSWIALTELLRDLDVLIDKLVESPPLDDVVNSQAPQTWRWLEDEP